MGLVGSSLPTGCAVNVKPSMGQSRGPHYISALPGWRVPGVCLGPVCRTHYAMGQTQYKMEIQSRAAVEESASPSHQPAAPTRSQPTIPKGWHPSLRYTLSPRIQGERRPHRVANSQPEARRGLPCLPAPDTMGYAQQALKPPPQQLHPGPRQVWKAKWARGNRGQRSECWTTQPRRQREAGLHRSQVSKSLGHTPLSRHTLLCFTNHRFEDNS